MKQNSMFSYVKRNNNKSKSVDGHEQCSSNVKEAPDPKRTKCNSIVKDRKWDGTYFIYVFFLSNDQILNVAVVAARLYPQNARTTQSLNFLLFNFCNSCLFVDVSNSDTFDFITSNSCFFDFC